MSTKQASVGYVSIVAALLCASAALGIVSPACSSGGAGGSPGDGRQPRGRQCDGP